MKAKALLKDSKYEILLWKEVILNDYNFDKKEWRVSSAGQQHSLKRINVVFHSENKKIFAVRFINAYMDRIFKNSTLKYTFYIKNIPTSDIREIRLSSKENILKSSRDIKQQNQSHTILSDEQLCSYIDTFYYTNFNKIIFD